jgi:hypothetical protein
MIVDTVVRKEYSRKYRVGTIRKASTSRLRPTFYSVYYAKPML